MGIILNYMILWHLNLAPYAPLESLRQQSYHYANLAGTPHHESIKSNVYLD